MHSSGNETRPFKEFVIKIASRCNLNCTYCYMYNLGDNSYKQQPRFISDTYAAIIADRIIEHCLEYGEQSVAVVFHGGEPLLMSKRSLSFWVNTIHERLANKNILVHFATQTNGTLVDNEWVSLLANLHVSVGVSLDGPREFHDQARQDHQGRGSFDATMQGIRVLQDNPHGSSIFEGVLSVINPLISPDRMWQFIQSSNIFSFDLRIPMATHDMQIPFTNTQLSEWLIFLFDEWFDSKERISIRMFNSLLLMYFDPSMIRDESLGMNSNDLIIIESDGTIEPSDNLKPCGEGFTKTKYNVLNNSFTEVLDHPLIRLSRKESLMIHEKCASCEFLRICGGGHLTERYSSASGFMNPSIYCSAYLKFYGHVASKIEGSIPNSLKSHTTR